MMPSNLLLLSNSKNAESDYLEHALEPLKELIGESGRRIAFLPYAAVRFSFDKYASAVADAFPEHEIISTHDAGNAAALIAGADAIAVGGGNTFCLMHAMYEYHLMEQIRESVAAGTPYIGWSAGSNVACPTVRTTNDMPIVEPRSFEALNLISFQINPHFLDAHPDGHMEETREERLEEFTLMNPEMPVLAIREGAWLLRVGESLRLQGENGARLFTGKDSPKELSPGSDLSFLL